MFVYILRDERSKLDAKTKQCIFLSYGEDGEFGYRLWDPMEQKIVYSRNVVFLKDQMIEDFEKPNKPKSSPSNPVDLCPDTS